VKQRKRRRRRRKRKSQRTYVFLPIPLPIKQLGLIKDEADKLASTSNPTRL